MATIKCEHCYTGFDYNIRTEGFFLRRKKIKENPICSHCKKENSPERRIICLNCGEANMYSILDGTNELHCISCNKPLPAITTIHLECPKCSLEKDVDINVENYACRGNDGTCSEIINVRSEVDWKKTYAQQGAVIRSSTPENYIIWKDKRHHFPYTSRMIVGESKEYALIEKNGKLACYKHEDSDFENGFLLGDTLKSRGIRLREAAENDEVSTLWIDIYWVSRQTISINKDWRDVIDLFIQGDRIEARIRFTDADKPANAIAEIVPCLKFGLQIIDAKAFYKKIQQDSLTRDQLTSLAVLDGHGRKLHRLTMEAVCNCLNEYFDFKNNLGFEYNKLKAAIEVAINTAFGPAGENWGLQVTDFHFDSILSWNEEKKSALKNSGLIHGEIEDAVTIADLLAVIKENHKAVEAIKEVAEKNHEDVKDLKETIQKNHREEMDGLKQVNAVGQAIEDKLDGVITEIRNELSNIVKEARNLGIISTEMADRLAAFQRLENTGLEELRNLEGMINNLRRAFLDYKKNSSEQEKASIDRLVQKLDNQQKAVIGRIDELEKEFSQRADAFSSTLDEILKSNSQASCMIDRLLSVAQNNNILSAEQVTILKGLLVTTKVTEEQCRYMEFEDDVAFESFVDDEQLNNLIGIALGLAYAGNLHVEKESKIKEYALFSFMMIKLFEKLLKDYYYRNVFRPFSLEFFPGEYNKCTSNDTKYPDLRQYSSGPSYLDPTPRNNRRVSYCWRENHWPYQLKGNVVTNISNYFSPYKDNDWWKNLLDDMSSATDIRNTIAHNDPSREDVCKFFRLLFRGENSLMRRLIMMRDVKVKEPEETVSAE